MDSSKIEPTRQDITEEDAHNDPMELSNYPNVLLEDLELEPKEFFFGGGERRDLPKPPSHLPRLTVGVDKANTNMLYCQFCKKICKTRNGLSQHLKSKKHVKTLVKLGKIPNSILSMMEKNENLLEKLDTSNSQLSLLSLLGIYDSLRRDANHSTNETHDDMQDDIESLLAAFNGVPKDLNVPPDLVDSLCRDKTIFANFFARCRLFNPAC